jgi:hypothetical protein
MNSTTLIIGAIALWALASGKLPGIGGGGGGNDGGGGSNGGTSVRGSVTSIALSQHPRNLPSRNADIIRQLQFRRLAARGRR